MYKKLTPRSVAIIRMIPVIHARVLLTRNTCAIIIGSSFPFVSSNLLEEGEPKLTFKIVSSEDPSFKRTTPTISPTQNFTNFLYK